jgi:hypothetical protein
MKGGELPCLERVPKQKLGETVAVECGKSAICRLAVTLLLAQIRRAEEAEEKCPLWERIKFDEDPSNPRV